MIGTDYKGGLAGAPGRTLNTGAGVAGTTIGGLIGGEYGTPAGNIMSGLASVASTIPGPWGAGLGAGLGLLGGLTNRAFGWKANKENINLVNSNIAELNNFRSDAGTWDAFQSNVKTMPAMMTFDNKFIGSNGWFNNKADRMANKLRGQLSEANSFAQQSLFNNASNINKNQYRNLAINYAALGGPLTMKQGLLTPFGYRFNLGGPLYSYGADWNNGLGFSPKEVSYKVGKEYDVDEFEYNRLVNLGYGVERI